MNAIREAREAAGYTQKEVAIELKVSAPTVSEWESGKKNPNTDNLKALSKMFNVPIDYLVRGDMSVVAKIKDLCKEKGLNLSTLETETGLGVNTIYKWDKSYPSADKLKKVADYFDISVDYLLTETGTYGFIDRNKKVITRHPTSILCALYDVPSCILAKDLNCSIDTVDKWKLCIENPNDEQLEQIADYFALDIKDLRKGRIPLQPDWEIYRRISAKKAPSTKMVLSRQAESIASKFDYFNESQQDFLRTVVDYIDQAGSSPSQASSDRLVSAVAEHFDRHQYLQASTREADDLKNE